MKQINTLFLLILLLLFSCTKDKNNSIINIDLNKATPNILYSSFVDSISYITLQVDTCPIGHISKIYFIDGIFFIKDDNRENGLFIFGKDYKLKKLINYFGPGPTEFIGISSFTINEDQHQISIHDSNGQKINIYNYDGDYIDSYPFEKFTLDFTYLNDNTYIFFTPLFRNNAPCGVWSENLSNGKITLLKNDIPQNAQTAFSSQFYQPAYKGIYYYDRINDDFSYINENGANILYQFNLKQRVPDNVREKSDPNVDGYAMIEVFANSKNYLLLNYFIYGERKFIWVILNKKNKSINISSQLYNDIDYTQIDLNSLFYINDSTLCRVIDPEEEKYDIKLQMLHLK